MKHGKTSNLSNNHIIISEVILLLDITMNNEYREKRNKIYIYILKYLQLRTRYLIGSSFFTLLSNALDGEMLTKN